MWSRDAGGQWVQDQFVLYTKTLSQKDQGLRMCLNGRMVAYFIQGPGFEPHHQTGGEANKIISEYFCSFSVV